MIGKQAYIKNMGSTQIFIKRPNEKEQFNDIHWEANYDGNQANIHVNVDNNGNNIELNANLDNNDLSRLLNIPAITGDLDQRLQNDFLAEQEQNPFSQKVDKTTPILILRKEKLRPKLRFQPFLRPQKRTRRPQYNKSAKVLKDPKSKLVGKTAALNYRTPLPKTMRIHLTPDSKGGRRIKNLTSRRSSSRRNRK
jgi:hypothetical protein